MSSLWTLTYWTGFSIIFHYSEGKFLPYKNPSLANSTRQKVVFWLSGHRDQSQFTDLICYSTHQNQCLQHIVRFYTHLCISLSDKVQRVHIAECVLVALCLVSGHIYKQICKHENTSKAIETQNTNSAWKPALVQAHLCIDPVTVHATSHHSFRYKS